MRPKPSSYAGRFLLTLSGLALGLTLVSLVFVPPEVVSLPEYSLGPGNAGESYYRDDPELGYAPTPGIRVSAVRRAAGNTLYDVEYTIDNDGLRHTPGSSADGPAIIFFGGSFTFGEGVEDDETLPAQLAAHRAGARVLNAAFHGYGPHQMLRALEAERFDGLAPDGIEHVVYQGLPGHEERAAGRAIWDQVGPRYELHDGELLVLGPFLSQPAFLAIKVLRRFGLTRRLLETWLQADAEEAREDEARYIEIVASAATLAREKWGASFTVIFWDSMGSDLADKLAARDLDVLRVSEIHQGRAAASFLLPVDLHPNPLAHREIAKMFARHLEAQETARTDPG